MKNYQKTLILLMCAVMLVAGSVFGTFAYLTDNDSVTNTFTVGKVGLKLDEAKVNDMGKVMDDDNVLDQDEREELDAYIARGDRWQPSTNDPAQEYHLLPGHTYIKDPTVTVDAGSEDAYIRMIVTVTFADTLSDADLAKSLDNIFIGYKEDVWPRHDKKVSGDKKTITYEYRYHETENGKNDNGDDEACELAPLFTHINVPGEYTNDQMAVLAGMTIKIEAHAIQAAGFSADNTTDRSAEDVAWDAFDAQQKTNSK